MRQMSPGSTRVLEERLAAARRRRAPCPPPGSRTSCRASRTPRPLCAISPTLDTVPIVGTSNAPCCLAVVDDRLIDAGVAAVRDHRLRVVQLAVGSPHLARRADRGRHRRVDDHVARHVQVGDALARIDHRQRRPRRVDGLEVGFDRGALVGGQRLDLRVDVADAVVGIDAERRRTSPRACRRRPCSTSRTACPNMIGSDTFIIVALRCSDSSTPFGLGVVDLPARRTP